MECPGIASSLYPPNCTLKLRRTHLSGDALDEGKRDAAVVVHLYQAKQVVPEHLCSPAQGFNSAGVLSPHISELPFLFWPGRHSAGRLWSR